MAALAEAHEADVLLLQEVRVAPGDRWLDELAGLLQMHYFFEPFQVYRGEDWNEEPGTHMGGLAILSRVLINPRAVRYASAGDLMDGHWDGQRGLVGAHIPGIGIVATTHWSVKGSFHAAYYDETKAALGHTTYVVGGDFNQSPLPHALSAGPTFPADNPTRAIDWFLVEGHDVKTFHVLESRISDHLPILIVLD